MTYSQKLRDPKWQKKRLLILERDGWKCCACGADDKNLQVHHLIYRKIDPWAYPDEAYQTLCGDCHKERQALTDEAVERFRMCLGSVDTNYIGKAAERLIDRALAGVVYDMAMGSMLQEALKMSNAGKGFLTEEQLNSAIFSLAWIQVYGKEESPDELNLKLPAISKVIDLVKHKNGDSNG